MKAVRLLCSCMAVAASGVLTWHSQACAQPANAPPQANGQSVDVKGVSPQSEPPSAAPPDSNISEPAPVPAPLVDSLQGQAKTDYDAGRLLFDAGDYGRALLLFQSAYAAVADPRLLWDAAACERDMRHYVKAIAIVQRFLAARSPLVTPEAANRAQAFLDAAEPLTAPLEVESNQPNAQVFLDDEDLGRAPLAPDSRVDVGVHRIVVKKPGFEPYSATLSVANSVKVHVTAVLRAVPPPVSSTDAQRDRASHASLAPTWVLIAGGALVLAGIATASYFIFKPGPRPEPVAGSIGSALRF